MYSLYTFDFTATSISNFILMFADDTIVGVMVTRRFSVPLNFEGEMVRINVRKTEEMTVDFWRCSKAHTPITINGAAVERVNGFRFLAVHLAEDLKCSHEQHTSIPFIDSAV